MEMYHESEREANDEPSIDLSYENGINNFMDTENYNENHQHAQDTNFYERNCDFDFFD
jgi:hypothetical protein